MLFLRRKYRLHRFAERVSSDSGGAIRYAEGVEEGEVGVNVLAGSFFFSLLDYLSGFHGSCFVA